MLVLVLLFSAWQHFELVRHGYEMERLQQERASEEEINRHLRLEIETLRSPRRIEEIAIKELQLVAPGRDQAIVIERVRRRRRPASPSSRRAERQARQEDAVADEHGAADLRRSAGAARLRVHRAA